MFHLLHMGELQKTKLHIICIDLWMQFLVIVIDELHIEGNDYFELEIRDNILFVENCFTYIRSLFSVI
jgi:hypothetical protein